MSSKESFPRTINVRAAPAGCDDSCKRANPHAASESDTSLSSASPMGKPTARRRYLEIPLVKGQQRSVIAAVRSLHGGDIFFSNPASISDRLLGPLDRSMSPSLQPDICK